MKRQFYLFTTLLLLCCLFPFENIKAQNLGLKVAGQDITHANASDIITAIGIGEGKMWYDEVTHTLTLDNVKLDSDRKNVIESTKSIEHFTINLIGDNILEQHGGARMYLASPKNTITGTGTLKVSSPWTQGIFVDCVDLEICGGCTVDAMGAWGICSDSSMGTLTINASKVIAEGEFGSIVDFAEIVLIDCAITAPENCYNEYGAIKDAYDNNIASQIIIDKVESEYDITISGVKVDENNAEDVLGDGKISYRSDTKTLSFNNANIKYNDGPVLKVGSDIIIDLKGSNRFTSDNTVVSLEKSALLRGKGTLNVKSNNGSGIEIKSGVLEFSNLSNVTVKGTNGIVGIPTENGDAPRLKVTKSVVNTTGSEMSLGGFANVEMEGCHIFTPENCIIKNGTAYVNGEVCNTSIVIKHTVEYPLWIAGEPVTSLNYKDVFGDGKVSYDRDNKILTIDGFVYETYDASTGISVMGDMESMTIVVKGTNIINTPYIGIICSSNTTFTGDGTLDVTGNTAGMAVQESTVTFNEGPVISICGDIGITCLTLDNIFGKMVLNGASLSVEGSSLGSITKFEDIILNECEIVSPKDVVFENNNMMLNGEICTKRIEFEKISTGINYSKTNNVNISVSNNMVTLSNVTIPTNVSIYNTVGQKVVGDIINNDKSYSLNCGSYIIVCGNITKKIII